MAVLITELGINLLSDDFTLLSQIVNLRGFYCSTEHTFVVITPLLIVWAYYPLIRQNVWSEQDSNLRDSL